ncbi:MAG: DNA-processing protein DprA [Pseudomonadota bacterium]
MNSAIQRQWLTLAHLSLSTRAFSRLADLYGDAGEILALPDQAWREAGATAAALQSRSAWHKSGGRTLKSDVDDAERSLTEAEAQLLPLGDSRYPPLLSQIDYPPALLYVAGDIATLSQPQFAVVGSRRCSASSARVAMEFAAGLVTADYGVCSGLALGIDAAAHRAALAAGGNTIAIVATGIDRCYPERHRSLWQDIVKQGAVVTEFNPGVSPRRENFPQRNRLISGLSVGVLVVEASLRSGSLITARSALEQNREVFAVPHSVLDPGGAGCHQLLRQGAGLATCVADLITEAASLRAVHDLREHNGRQPPARLRPVWECLGHDALSVDELASTGETAVEQVLSALMELEQAGFVEQRGGLYQRKL